MVDAASHARIEELARGLPDSKSLEPLLQYVNELSENPQRFLRVPRTVWNNLCGYLPGWIERCGKNTPSTATKKVRVRHTNFSILQRCVRVVAWCPACLVGVHAHFYTHQAALKNHVVRPFKDFIQTVHYNSLTAPLKPTKLMPLAEHCLRMLSHEEHREIYAPYYTQIVRTIIKVFVQTSRASFEVVVHEREKQSCFVGRFPKIVSMVRHMWPHNVSHS